MKILMATLDHEHSAAVPRGWPCALKNTIGSRITILTLALLSVITGSKLSATPLHALREADNCAGCHNPGRSQRPVLERRCTLDCQGCHIDPAGSGPRNEWGYYYSHTYGVAKTFFKPIDPLKDKSRYSVHLDARVIQRKIDGGPTRSFPMSSEGSLRLKPFMTHLHFIYQGLLLGRIGDDSLRTVRSDDRRYREKYAIMLDALPMNTYVRAYQGPPMYGLRRPNHSLWIRERLGLDQFAMTRALEVGGTPNVPFMRASFMQGDPYVNAPDRQRGTSWHAGFRGVTLGWHVNGSGWHTRSDLAKVDMNALGGGANVLKTLIYGERNWRKVGILESTDLPTNRASWDVRVHPSSEISEYTLAFAQLDGIMPGMVLETLHDPNTASTRRSVFVDLRPIPWFQFELHRRFETGTRSLVDTLAVAHVYADF